MLVYSDKIESMIETILLGCDDSILSIRLLNGYQIDSISLENFNHKNEIVNGKGAVIIDYAPFLTPINDKYIRLYKDRFDLNLPFESNVVYTFPNPKLNEKFKEIQQDEVDYLYKLINLLRIFKTGNIGFKHIFITHKCVFGVNMNTNFKSINENRNIANQTIYSLTSNEIIECNQFLSDYITNVYTTMLSVIQGFCFSLDQIDDNMCFEKIITVMETILLKHNETNKKENLSKRVAVIVGKNDTEIKQIYDKMKIYYKFRSESVHESEYANINKINLNDLEELSRNVMKHFLHVTKTQLASNPTITWKEIKRQELTNIKNTVTLKATIF